MQTLADQVRNMRLALGMTQEQLAERSGLTQSMIAEIENGKRANLSMTTIQKLAQGLNCHFIPQLMPYKDVSQILDEQSTQVAQKLISISSGSAAIEMQLPSQDAITRQIAELKKGLLEHKSALWWKI